MRYITGHTRGLGQTLCKELNCIGLGRPEYDIETDIDKICSLIKEDDLLILNAYANGTQLEYARRLYNKASIITFGSMAASYPDPALPEYSKQKRTLEDEFLHMAIHSRKPMLYLKLTDSSYSNHKLVINAINFWLDNPQTTYIGFDVKQKW
jgi:hypothetical protein